MTSLYDHKNYNTGEPELYNKNDVDSWKSALEKNGYVVIKDILSKEDYDNSLELFKKDWNMVSPGFNFDDETTWKRNNMPLMYDKGMTFGNGLSQSDFMWSLRTNSNIKSIFEDLHNTNELVTSFDGFSVFTSPKQDTGKWLHIDLNEYHPWVDEFCPQGAYNFFKVDTSDAGFVVVPYSHETYKPPDDILMTGRQFISLDENDEHYQYATKLIIPENSFILWNSYTIHGSEGMDKNMPISLNRLTSYITMFPKNLRSDTIKRKRLAGYYMSECCNHYANRHDVKGIPYGMRSRYLANEFNTIKSTLTEDGSIPADRLILI